MSEAPPQASDRLSRPPALAVEPLPTEPARCLNHPELPAPDACSHCGRPFCEQCLTHLMGRTLCGWCRDVTLHRMQPGAQANPAPIILWVRIFDVFMMVTSLGIGGLGAFFFAMPLLVSNNYQTPPTGAGLAMTQVITVFLLLSGLSSLLIYLPPLIGLGRRRRWAWTWQFTALILSIVGAVMSITSVGLLALTPAIILLVYWVRPEVRAYCDG